ncbi:hypothetical protein MRX96_054578 [Rhipicephalus microplus]
MQLQRPRFLRVYRGDGSAILRFLCCMRRHSSERRHCSCILRVAGSQAASGRRRTLTVEKVGHVYNAYLTRTHTSRPAAPAFVCAHTSHERGSLHPQ